MRCTALRASLGRRDQLLFVVLLLASPARANPGPVAAVAAPAAASRLSSTSAVSVDWPAVVRLVQQHPRLAAGRLLVDAARGGVDAALAVPNPTLAGSVGQGRARSGDASRAEVGLALTMPLSWLAQRRSRVDAAAGEVELAVAESEALRRAVLVQLRTLFWSLAYEQARVAAHEALLGQTSTLVRLVRRRVEMGEVRPVEGIRVEIELEKITSDLESARVACAARQAELALWVGLPVGQALVAVADLETLPRAMARDTALARATHPALGVARARARLLAAEVGTERMARVPALSVNGFTLHELDRRAYGVGLTVDLPLGNWNAGRIAQAEARLAAGRKASRGHATGDRGEHRRGPGRLPGGGPDRNPLPQQRGAARGDRRGHDGQDLPARRDEPARGHRRPSDPARRAPPRAERAGASPNRLQPSPRAGRRGASMSIRPTLDALALVLLTASLSCHGGDRSEVANARPAPADDHAEHGRSDGEGQPEGAEAKPPSDLDSPVEVLVARTCEHQKKTFECDQCRYEVGFVRAPASLMQGGLITTVKAEQQRVAVPIALTGEIRFDERRVGHVSSQVQGIVKQVHVALGDRVKQGQALVRIESVVVGRRRPPTSKPTGC
ncbi:MAG: TolC family protein [Proteobacteria bacterium]|nr:TolC family protein [Pseudomonadota bacterium]